MSRTFVKPRASHFLKCSQGSISRKNTHRYNDSTVTNVCTFLRWSGAYFKTAFFLSCFARHICIFFLLLSKDSQYIVHTLLSTFLKVHFFRMYLKVTFKTRLGWAFFSEKLAQTSIWEEEVVESTFVAFWRRFSSNAAWWRLCILIFLYFESKHTCYPLKAIVGLLWEKYVILKSYLSRNPAWNCVLKDFHSYFLSCCNF